MAPTRTDPDRIRNYADEVAEYDYEQAVSIIQRDSALAVDKRVQNSIEANVIKYCLPISRMGSSFLGSIRVH
ncbi:hypothetical protein IFM47457_09089 [Aspergillus lentulus]|nr:hypothetical protein IFM47457_09089 [Aspergillus lentulus]